MNINLFASGGKTTRINNLRNMVIGAQLVDIYGARGRTRTGTGLLPRDFKSTGYPLVAYLSAPFVCLCLVFTAHIRRGSRILFASAFTTPQ